MWVHGRHHFYYFILVVRPQYSSITKSSNNRLHFCNTDHNAEGINRSEPLNLTTLNENIYRLTILGVV
ncbi:hypothetical protein VCRA2114E365_160102 [Vibrio crassostreae]|nr:hypothetical protein VCRA2117O376_150103 [Vibrio crassostreae]CAK1783382.1 hypothetical protein VCRA2114O369_150105 [Vibrio crassostreae]CAK1789115.1 hypothetical protein VCRA2113O357_160014 [Vibrio crassostreae]CAK1790608.1 hypothetical protein VCRA2113O354_160014 [Vibrio crassostreae]CAK1799544.1 hypothetical protein VCRA2114O367_160105 [Vibrio crassostreae]